MNFKSKFVSQIGYKSDIASLKSSKIYFYLKKGGTVFQQANTNKSEFRY